jgi:hypothetical protein
VKKIEYRKLKKYKYGLTKQYKVMLPLKLDNDVFSKWIRLSADGELVARKGYCWDGASGPTIDSKSCLRASLVHDCLYQLMREELISVNYKATADTIFKDLLIEDGMSKWRAKLWYMAVSKFGKKYMNVGTKQDKIYTAP